jgi:hypothetical protein
MVTSAPNHVVVSFDQGMGGQVWIWRGPRRTTPQNEALVADRVTSSSWTSPYLQAGMYHVSALATLTTGVQPVAYAQGNIRVSGLGAANKVLRLTATASATS